MMAREVLPRTMLSSTSRTSLSLNSRGDGVELHPDRALPLVVVGHDECPADVAVLDQRFAVFQVELAGDLDGRVAGRIGDRDDDVDLQVLLSDLLGQEPAEVDPAAVDVDLVDERIRPGEIDPFEQAGRMRAAGDCRFEWTVALPGR